MMAPRVHRTSSMSIAIRSNTMLPVDAAPRPATVTQRAPTSEAHEHVLPAPQLMAKESVRRAWMEAASSAIPRRRHHAPLALP